MNDELNFNASEVEVYDTGEAIDMIEVTLEKFLDTANVNMVYGEPVQNGDTTIIPCAETFTALGFGAGAGGGSSARKEEEAGTQAETRSIQPARDSGGGGGGGGGGRTFARPVAVIVASPEGVRVEPVVDVTKVALAAFTTAGFMAGMVARMMRARRPMRIEE